MFMDILWGFPFLLDCLSLMGSSTCFGLKSWLFAFRYASPSSVILLEYMLLIDVCCKGLRVFLFAGDILKFRLGFSTFLLDI